MNQVALFTLICVLLTVNRQVRAEADQSCDKWSCEFDLTDPDVVRRQFTKIDHNKVWLVYFNLTTEKSKARGSGETEILAWAHSSTSPFLSFDSNFEFYSFSILTQSVTVINIQAKSKGPDPLRDCLKDLSPYCRNRTISKVLLNKVTDTKGAVCFGESSSRRCCEYSDGDIICDIEPRSGWRWIDINYLSAVVGISGYFFFTILLCLLPSLPDTQNRIELTAPQEPSPPSFTNVFVKCFSNKPEYCFRDAFVTFCCRITVLLGLLPSIWYLYTIAFLTISNKVFIKQDPLFRLFHNVGFCEIMYYAFALFAVALAIVPLVQYYLQHQPMDNVPLLNIKKRSCFLYIFNHHCYAECTKRALKTAKVVLNSCFWYFLPLCCQDNRNIRKVWQIPTCCFGILSPCFFIFCVICSSVLVLVFPFFVLFYYPMHNVLHISHMFSRINKRFVFLCVCISGLVAAAQIYMMIFSAVLLTSFVTYTIIGFVLNYKLYLSQVSAVLLVINYIYHCYHTTNKSYDELRKLVFEMCIKQQRELDCSLEDDDIVNHQQLRPVRPPPLQPRHEQRGERQPLLQGDRVQQLGHLANCDEILRKLVYIDENNGSPLIPKKLFENICWRLKPTGTTFFAMVAKMVALTMFVMMIVVVVLTLTPRTEFGVLTQATVTLFVGSIPQVFLVCSNNIAKKELQILEMKKCIQHCLMNYLENGELSGEQFLRQEQQAINWI